MVDPLSELYSSLSPYHYSGNSPINNIDIGGMGFVGAYNTWNETGSADTYIYDFGGYTESAQDASGLSNANVHSGPPPNSQQDPEKKKKNKDEGENKEKATNSGGNNPYIKSITVDETTQSLSMTWDMQQEGVADVTQGGYTVSTGKRNNTPNGTCTVTWKKPHLSPPHECCRFAVNITGAFFLHTYECSNPIWTRPASAGCVRIMDPAIAEMIYNNVKIGVTQVTITGEWPGFN